MKFPSFLILALLITASQASAQKCANWCEKNPKNWDKKCTWTNCNGCDACIEDLPSQICADWCAKNAKPWEKKCSWTRCEGCDACEDPPLQTSKPNIILILADDVGTGDIPFYWKGSNTSSVEMPNLEKLAQKGVLFEDAHSTPFCAPSRYMLLSGNYPHRGLGYMGSWNFESNSNQFTDGQKSIAQVLGEANYHTGMFGKWHLGAKIPSNGVKNKTHLISDPRHDWSLPLIDGPASLGFHESLMSIGGVGGVPHNFFRDDMLDYNRDQTVFWEGGEYSMPYGTSIIGTKGEGDPEWDVSSYDMTLVNETKAFIDTHLSKKSKKPFFAYVAFGAVHWPFAPPKKYIDGSQSEGRYISRYLDMLGMMDKAVGSLMETIKEKDLEKETIFIFTSDNGGLNAGNNKNGHQTSGPLRGIKKSIYDGGHRVPLIISQPGSFPQGTRRKHVVGLNDLYATICELVGLSKPPFPSAIDSISFASYFKSGKGSDMKRKSLGTFNKFGEFVDGKRWSAQALRKGVWKFIHFPHKNKMELYNMRDDIGESNNKLEGQPSWWLKNKAESMCKELREIGYCPIGNSTNFMNQCKKDEFSFDENSYCDFTGTTA